MGAKHTYGTAGATGGGFASQPGSLQPAFTDLVNLPVNDWQRRGPKSWRDRSRWASLWPRGQFSMAANDGAFAGTPIGLDYSGCQGFEPFSCDGDGNQSLKFVKGRCVDANDEALSGVTVQAFRTSDDAFAGYEVQSRTDGSFDLPTNFPGVNHYVVAYLPGAPDRAGTTANTLAPTNVDGT